MRKLVSYVLWGEYIDLFHIAICKLTLATGRPPETQLMDVQVHPPRLYLVTYEFSLNTSEVNAVDVLHFRVNAGCYPVITINNFFICYRYSDFC